MLLEIDVANEQGSLVVIGIEKRGPEVSVARFIEVATDEVGFSRFHDIIHFLAIRECGFRAVRRSLEDEFERSIVVASFLRLKRYGAGPNPGFLAKLEVGQGSGVGQDRKGPIRLDRRIIGVIRDELLEQRHGFNESSRVVEVSYMLTLRVVVQSKFRRRRLLLRSLCEE